jgi:hypothetical protein
MTYVPAMLDGAKGAEQASAVTHALTLAPTKAMRITASRFDLEEGT